jgi:hypothetical protein
MECDEPTEHLGWTVIGVGVLEGADSTSGIVKTAGEF